MTKFCLRFLVLIVVTSCCCWLLVDSGEVLRKNVFAEKSNETNSQQIEVNAITSSTESQGTLDETKTNRTSTTTAEAKEAGNRSIDTIEGESIEKNDDSSSSTVASNSIPTTSRPVRNGAPPRSGANRDNKLMSLLAARRSALQRDRFRTHRRTPTPNRSVIESQTRDPSDPRTVCERNCTKNFTRRTTASCIRRCVALQKATNSSVPAVRTKVDEKDNNEILETDESSHGFFVIAKDLNDTVNHIGDEIKSAEGSTEKNNRNAARPTASSEIVDLPPYLYFGQKLPPLRPNRRSNQTSDSFVRQSTERTRNWNRSYPIRNYASYSRFHNSRNVIRPTTTPVGTRTASEVVRRRLVSDDDKLVTKDEGIEILRENLTETILIRGTTDRPNTASVGRLVDLTSQTTATATVATATVATATVATATVATATIATATVAVATGAAINSTSSEAFSTASISVTPASSSAATTPTTSTSTETITYETSFTPVDHVITTNPIPTTLEVIPYSITLDNTQEDAKIPEASDTVQMESFTEVHSVNGTDSKVEMNDTRLPPEPPPELANVYDQVDVDKPNLIIFYNITTEKPPTSSTSRVFTRTTISSSVRSTVHPKQSNPVGPTSVVYYSLSSESTTSSSSSGSVDYKHATPSTNQVDKVTMANEEVTIEMKRINMATYVLAGLGMFPIVIIILYVAKTIIFKRRFKDDDDLDQFTSDGQPISPVRKMDHMDDDCSDQYSIVTERDFDRKNLRFKSLLGEGNFGQVWKAEADDLIGHMGTTRIVAVKTVRSGSTQLGLKEEAEIMRKLGSHPNVVTLLGACLETEPHLLIMEYAMRGRLLSLLRAARSATNILPASVPGGRSLAPLSPRTLAGFALDIARGMEYISEKKIVHRDLAARNVLLDHNGVCKICDFGMSIDLERARQTQKKTESLQQTQCFDTRFHFDFGGRWMSNWNNNNNNDKKQNHDSVSKRPALPIRWMAPEALQYHIFSIKTDVWAFGIVLWEVATLGCTPYPNLSGREVIRNVPNGVRPELPQDGRPEFYELMQRCWRKDPQLRPSFRDARIDISRISCKWHDDDMATSDYMDVSGFSEDLEHGMVYFNRRISEFECEI